MTDHFHPEHGASPEYDEQVERESERKRAFYNKVARNHKLEKLKDELEHRYNVMHDEYVVALGQGSNSFECKAAKARMDLEEKLLLSFDDVVKRSDAQTNKEIREQATAAGEKTYMPVTACRNGHYARRYVSSGACTECDKIGWKDGKLRPQVKLTASA